mgnify:CR=1 FL=1|jgi:hypothetical protein
MYLEYLKLSLPMVLLTLSINSKALMCASRNVYQEGQGERAVTELSSLGAVYNSLIFKDAVRHA